MTQLKSTTNYQPIKTRVDIKSIEKEEQRK